MDASGSTSSQIRTSQRLSHSGRNAKTESTDQDAPGVARAYELHRGTLTPPTSHD